MQYWLGCACAALGEKPHAREHWLAAANSQGDFEEMSVRAFSAMTYYAALAWQRLGRKAKARRLLGDLLAYAEQWERAEAKIDYFATSLPAMLLVRGRHAVPPGDGGPLSPGAGPAGTGAAARARRLLKGVLQRDPHHALAADLLAAGD